MEPAPSPYLDAFSDRDVARRIFLDWAALGGAPAAAVVTLAWFFSHL